MSAAGTLQSGTDGTRRFIQGCGSASTTTVRRPIARAAEPRRGQRNLLLEDDPNQRRKSGLTVPERRGPEAFEGSPEIGVSIGQLTGGRAQKDLGQWSGLATHRAVGVSIASPSAVA